MKATIGTFTGNIRNGELNEISSYHQNECLRVNGSSLFSKQGLAQIQPPCPVPPTAVSASVNAEVSYDKTLKLYTYKYVLSNERSSQLKLAVFYIKSDAEPQNLVAAQKWDAEFLSGDQAIFWNSYVGTEINIGSKLSGFSFQSPRPPGPVKFYVAGKAKIPKAVPTATDDEPIPDCPGFFFEVDDRDNKTVVGLTEGPMPPGQVAARIRIHRAKFADENKAPYLEKNELGVVHVTLLGTDQFDVTKVDTSTLAFGPSHAKPLSIKTIETDLNERERKTLGILGDNDKERNRKKKHKSLLLKFAVKDLGLRCNLDHALFINGKISGSPFFGGAEVSPEKCKAAATPTPAPGKQKRKKDDTD